MKTPLLKLSEEAEPFIVNPQRTVKESEKLSLLERLDKFLNSISSSYENTGLR